MAWPTDRVDSALHPSDAQRAKLQALQSALSQAADTIKAACPSQPPATPPERLADAGKRLQAMLQGVETVQPALADFYNSLERRSESAIQLHGSATVRAERAIDGYLDRVWRYRIKSHPDFAWRNPVYFLRDSGIPATLPRAARICYHGLASFESESFVSIPKSNYNPPFNVTRASHSVLQVKDLAKSRMPVSMPWNAQKRLAGW